MKKKRNLKESLRCSVEIANLSPSSHNSQPWELAFIENQEKKENLEKFLKLEENKNSSVSGYIIICLNQQRNLTALKSHRLEMLMSCGAFVELLLMDLARQGWQSEYCWVNEGVLNSSKELFQELPVFWKPVIIFALSKGEVVNPPISLTDIENRTTNRGPYKTGNIGINSDNFKNLQSFAFPEKVKDCQLTLIEENKMIKKYASFVARYSDVDFTHPQAWKETYSFMHFSDSDIEKAEYGFGITHIFGPMSKFKKKFYQIFLAPGTMQILKYFGYAKYIGYQFGNLVKQSSMLAYLNFKQDKPDVLTQIAGGAIMLNFWLKVTQQNLTLHPISIILQHPQIRIKLQQEMDLPTGRGFFFTRLGSPIVKFPPAYRRKNLNEKIYLL